MALVRWLAVAALLVGVLLFAGPFVGFRLETYALAPCELSPTLGGTVGELDMNRSAWLGDPISGATVTLRALDYNATYTDVTGADGYYSITITKPAGNEDDYERFNMTVEAPGYDTVYLGQSICGDAERNVVMTPSAETPPPEYDPSTASVPSAVPRDLSIWQIVGIAMIAVSLFVLLVWGRR